MAQWLERFTCAVCYEPYDSSSQRPLVLPCGHTFCAQCCHALLSPPPQGGAAQGCPSRCQLPLQLRPEQLPPNYALQQEAEAAAQECGSSEGLGPLGVVLPRLDPRGLELGPLLKSGSTCDAHRGRLQGVLGQVRSPGPHLRHVFFL